ncbi:MAG: TraR/DksA C4-type zinc finger protein [Candidatus Desulfacyla sp.]
MDIVQLDIFQKRLEAMRRELLETDEALRRSTRPVNLDQARVGRLSRMDAMQGQAMAIEAQRRSRSRLGLVEQALARVASGDYGICIVCEEDIDPRRLEFDPSALLCITCARSTET